MHLVVRLTDTPLRILEPDSRVLGYTIIGGARSAPYVRDISLATVSVGAQLAPGAAALLFGIPAGELAERHTSLEDVWGSAATRMRERLLEVPPQRQLEVFESLLAERLPKLRGLHPAVAQALEHFKVTSDIQRVVVDSGYSHRRFIALFREAVGLSPKVYCRVLRLQSALTHLSTDAPLAALALDAGYSDQPHFTREFRALAGVSPGRYRALAPQLSHHLEVKSVQDPPLARRQSGR